MASYNWLVLIIRKLCKIVDTTLKACQWLLIFDNAEDASLLLPYWPLASRGRILITTRNYGLTFEPAQQGIEVYTFTPLAGSELLFHLLSHDVAQQISSMETQSAYKLSEKLSGHALAISQMAGLIHQRSWSIEDFVAVYEEHPKRLHSTSSFGRSIDTVWQLSFESLGSEASALLGVLSFLVPDGVPQSLFEIQPELLPPGLKFCADKLE